MRTSVPGRRNRPAALRDSLTLQRNCLPPTSTKEVSERPGVLKSIATSVESVLKSGGVVASFLDNKVSQIDPAISAGTATFWSQGLHCSEFNFSFAVSCDSDVHATCGIPDGVDWFPLETAYTDGVTADDFELLTASGFAVSTNQTAEGVALFAEASSAGVAPALFAGFCMDADQKTSEFRTATSLAESAPVKDPTNGSNTIVHQAPTFLLADLFNERDAAESDSLRKVLVDEFDDKIHNATLSTARLVKKLAERRILKLNVNSCNVAFVPELYVSDDGESLESNGYGYESSDGPVTKGKPKLLDFSEMTLCVPEAARGYSVDAAYVTSMLALLARTRAVHGARAMIAMMNAITGKTPSGVAIPEPDLPEKFDEINLGAAIARSKDSAKSFASSLVGVSGVDSQAVRTLSGILSGETPEADTQVFSQLVKNITQLSTADCCIYAPLCCEEEEERKKVCAALQRAKI